MVGFLNSPGLQIAIPALITVGAGFMIHRSFVRFQKQKHLHELRIDHFKRIANLGLDIINYIMLFHVDLHFRTSLPEEKSTNNMSMRELDDYISRRDSKTREMRYDLWKMLALKIDLYIVILKESQLYYQNKCFIDIGLNYKKIFTEAASKILNDLKDNKNNDRKANDLIGRKIEDEHYKFLNLLLNEVNKTYDNSWIHGRTYNPYTDDLNKLDDKPAVDKPKKSTKSAA